MSWTLSILLTLSSAVAPEPRDAGTALAPAFAPPPSTQASTQPADLVGSLDELIETDPRTRAAARERLMLLTREDLPLLRSAAEQRAPMRLLLRSALHEIVIQVYLTGIHNFQGGGAGLLGITPTNDGLPPMVQRRMQGHDSYRVLQDGDVIVGLALGGPETPMQPVGDFIELRDQVGKAQVGDWVTLRILRNGMAKEVRIRIGPNFAPPVAGQPDMDLIGAEDYWRTTFDRPLKVATTQPAE